MLSHEYWEKKDDCLAILKKKKKNKQAVNNPRNKQQWQPHDLDLKEHAVAPDSWTGWQESGLC
jgi:hypothetical protein